MKKLIFLISAFIVMLVTACNSGNDSSKKEDMSKMDTDSSMMIGSDVEMKELSPAFTNVDPGLASSLKIIVDHYLHVKNALVSNDEKEAASGAKAMYEAMGKVDKSLFTSEQKKVYDGVEDDLKEHAEHISESKIDHQREHFSMMSEDIYEIVKAFGGGRTLYHDHCPMANDNKGAMWLSGRKEIKNPYFGGKMAECVKVPEMLK